VLRLT
jgi:hypothetical protein